MPLRLRVTHDAEAELHGDASQHAAVDQTTSIYVSVISKISQDLWKFHR